MSHLNQGFPDELDRMAAKHAPARQAWGVELSRDRWLRWAGAMHRGREAWLGPVREQPLAEDAITLGHATQYRYLSTG